MALVQLGGIARELEYSPSQVPYFNGVIELPFGKQHRRTPLRFRVGIAIKSDPVRNRVEFIEEITSIEGHALGY